MISIIQLGTIDYATGLQLQQKLVDLRKADKISDTLLLLEHKHVITLGRNAKKSNIIASPELLTKRGVEVVECDRGGDVTYHGPGQIVGYPIFDLREWKRDVVAYIRALEQAIIDALAEFGIESWRDPGATGVWTSQGKICAIGVHISRWVTSHGFALNHTTDLSYFRYIVPCGLTKPVTSIEAHGVHVARSAVQHAISRRLAEHFGHPTSVLTEEQHILTENK